MKTIEWLPVASTNRFERLDYIAQDNPLAAISQDEEIELIRLLHSSQHWPV